MRKDVNSVHNPVRHGPPLAVKKAEGTVFYIEPGKEWATVILEPVTKPHHGGKLTILSSHGNYGHQWGNTGIPFNEFLFDMNFETFAEKTCGSRIRQYDAFGSYRAANEWRKAKFNDPKIEELLLAHQVQILDGAAGLEKYVASLNQYLDEKAFKGERLELPEVYRESINPKLEYFWTQLWPAVRSQLQS